MPLFVRCLVSALAFACTSPAWAQSWPSKPVGIVVTGPHLYKLRFDMENDLAPVAPLARTLMFLVAR